MDIAAIWNQAEDRLGGDQGANLLTVAAIVLLATGLANWTWQVARPGLPTIVAQPLGTRTASGPAETDLTTLFNANLFGKSEQEAPGVIDPSQVPLSSLNLVLTGVVAAGPQSIALISVRGQPQAPFAIGEEVTHGAVLDSVYPDRAILQRNGILESLVLEDVARGLPQDSVMAPLPVSPNTPVDQQIRAMGGNSFALPRSLIGDQLKNPQFLRDAHIVARKEGGFLVRKLKPGSLYEKLGLKRGDIIKSVNGEAINNISDAMRHYQQMNTLGSVQVEVTRGGKTEILQFQLE